MKKITLIELSLVNWAGITEVYKMNAGRNVFAGENGTGKTMLANCEKWIQTGKNLVGSTKNEIKSLSNGEIESRGLHAAFAKYDIDGKPLIIGRSLKGKWTKKRGELEETRSGNDIKYYTGAMDIDDPDCQVLSAKQFQTLLDSEFGDDYRKASTINYLSSMHWKERRKFLLPLCHVNEAKIIGNIQRFTEMLDGKTPEEKKILADARKKILKDKFSENKAAKAEREQDTKRAGTMTLEQAEKEVVSAQGKIEARRKEIEKLKQGDNLEKIQELNRKLSEIIQGFEEKKHSAVSRKELLERNASGIKREISHLKDFRDTEKKRIENLRESGRAIISEKKAIQEKTVEDLSNICDKCGQSLPDDVLNKLKQDFMKTRADELKRKQQELDKNNAMGLGCKEEIEKIESLILAHENTLKDLENTKPDPILNQSADDLEEVKTIKKQISELREPEEENIEIKKLELSLETLNATLSLAQEKRAAVKACEDSKNRRETLSEEREKLTKENNKIQTFLTAYDEYMNSYASAVQEPVNALIPGVKFKMFEMSEMNKRVETCEICDDKWKRYWSMCSTGERVGIDLNCTAFIQKHLQISAPIWIDERQSYTGDIPLDCQYFELVTKKGVETLTKEK